MHQQGTQFRIFLKNGNHILAQLLADKKEQPNHHRILVTIADEQGAIVFKMRQRSDKLCLGAALQTESKRTTRFEDFLQRLREAGSL